MWNPFRTPPTQSQVEQCLQMIEELRADVYRWMKKHEMRERRAATEATATNGQDVAPPLPRGVLARRGLGTPGQ